MPPGRRRQCRSSDDEDYEEERRDQSLFRMASQAEKEGGPKSKRKKSSKPKRRDMPEKKRRWLNERDRLVEKAEDEAYLRDSINAEKNGKTVLKVDATQIRYAETPEQADEMASALVDALRSTGDEYFLIGTDVEGNYDTLQIYVRCMGEVFAYVFQLNFIVRNGLLPTVLTDFLSLPNLIFCGKLVEKEMMDFFRKFNFPQSRLNHFLIIPLLTLIVS